MPPPIISGKECIAALQRAGFEQVRQKGSHVFMVRRTPFNAASVPLHKELDRGTLRGILRDCGLTVEEFVALLRK